MESPPQYICIQLHIHMYSITYTYVFNYIYICIQLHIHMYSIAHMLSYVQLRSVMFNHVMLNLLRFHMFNLIHSTCLNAYTFNFSFGIFVHVFNTCVLI